MTENLTRREIKFSSGGQTTTMDDATDVNSIHIQREDIIKEGWLMKQSRHLKDWRRRWIVLTPQYICSFKSAEAQYSVPTEALALKSCTTVKSAEDDMSSKQHVFRVDSPQRVFFLAAASSAEKESWIGHIGKLMVKRSVMKEDSDEEEY